MSSITIMRGTRFILLDFIRINSALKWSQSNEFHKVKTGDDFINKVLISNVLRIKKIINHKL